MSSSITEDSRISLKLPVLVALLTGAITSTVTITGAYLLLKGRLENMEAAQVRESGEREKADGDIYIMNEKADKRLTELERSTGSFITSVSTSLTAVKVKQEEDGKKLDLLVNVLITKQAR